MRPTIVMSSLSTSSVYFIGVQIVLLNTFYSQLFTTSATLTGAGGGNVTSLVALATTSVSLPCDITLPNNKERVTLILWYREDLGIPIYSVEIGERGTFANAEVWSDEKWLGNRAQFHPDAFPSILRVHDVKASDAGMYRCRVDFTEAQTRNTMANLSVIVPPNPVVIFDENGSRRTNFVGPYREGATVTLICDAFGGNPAPRLTWSRDGQLIDDSFHLLPNGSVRNEISFRNVDRTFLHAELTCSASNTELARPTTAMVHVDMNFLPVSVTIVNKSDRLVVGQAAQVVCKSTGSRPPAHITWFMGRDRIEGGVDSTSSDGNTTVNILTFQPTMQNIGKELTCRAANPLIKSSDIFDTISLKIDYAPRVSLALGHSLSAKSIYENGDVYFDCRVDSRPPPTRIEWQHNGAPLRHNSSDGVIITNQSLVLQKIKRQKSGAYTCEAINNVGRGVSKPIVLDVKYVPVCKHTDPIVFGVGKGEMVDVLCDVVANPVDVEFRWTFNNSADFIHVPHGRAVTVNATRSKLTYTPHNNKDYGTLMCSATNEVGRQRDPCIFHIILAVAPDPVDNCTVINKSSETFHLQCIPGFDGGMEQSFLVQVMDRATSEIKYNRTSATPDVFIETLAAGTSYLVTVTPMNKKGVGQSSHVLVDTLRHPDVGLAQAEAGAADVDVPGGLKSAKRHKDQWAVMAGIVVGSVGCVVVLVLVSVTVRYCVCKRRRGNEPAPPPRATKVELTPPSDHFSTTPLTETRLLTAPTGSIPPPPCKPAQSTVRKGILKQRHTDWEFPSGTPDLLPPPPALTSETDECADGVANHFQQPSGTAIPIPRPPAGFSSTLPRRTSREGLLSEPPAMSEVNGDGSSDPLLQIPDELSAVLTLKRGVKIRSASPVPLVGHNSTPLTKRKRESIV